MRSQEVLSSDHGEISTPAAAGVSSTAAPSDINDILDAYKAETGADCHIKAAKRGLHGLCACLTVSKCCCTFVAVCTHHAAFISPLISSAALQFRVWFQPNVGPFHLWLQMASKSGTRAAPTMCLSTSFSAQHWSGQGRKTLRPMRWEHACSLCCSLINGHIKIILITRRSVQALPEQADTAAGVSCRSASEASCCAAFQQTQTRTHRGCSVLRWVGARHMPNQVMLELGSDAVEECDTNSCQERRLLSA